MLKFFSLFLSYTFLCGCGSLQLPHYSDQNSSFKKETGLQSYVTSSKAPPISEVLKNKSRTLASLKTVQNKKNETYNSIIWPVNRATMTRGFFKSNFGSPHLGLDLAAKRGTPILAAQSGKVIFADTGFTGYGKFIIIESANEWATFYGHLDSIQVKEGQFVYQGQTIGKMGATGRASGVHLHFELRKNKKAIDPFPYLNQRTLAQNK